MRRVLAATKRHFEVTDMRKLMWTKLVFATLLGAACVTINVYFPAAAAEKAADQVIQRVWGDDAAPAPATSPKPSDKTSWNPEPGENALVLVARTVLESIVPAAEAAEPDLDVNSPATRAIEASMAARHAQLGKYYDSGAVGLTGDGFIDVRDQNAVPLPERGALKKLVADENHDRQQLYAEKAKASGHPEWESDIRAAFARRWIARAKSGWYYKDGANWAQK
jgi:uncharacterized protein YdbL (DUF1318 family)